MAKIIYVNIIPGLIWVDIPAIGLKLMCGSPADSVKHLTKKGLIHSTQLNGVTFDTGPNAILLSDIMLQNGQFANLSEFPVLQMLYKQGMMIPGHPNNSGEKPLLVGTQAQIDAQLNYIYRGNYGLTTKEELLETGMSEEEAEMYMAIKLYFAFGNIQESTKLLDTTVINHHKTEIKSGAFIQRKSLNNFELTFEDETVQIDLNLPTNTLYDVPYPLGFYNIKRDYFSIVHSGDGDGWDINRPCMGSIIMYQGKVYLIDAGPNTLTSLLSLGISINEIEGIFHTHAHDDHFAGLTTLMRSDHRIKYYASAPVIAATVQKLSSLLSVNKETIAHYFELIALESDRWNNIAGLEVKPIFSPHPAETNIFFFRTLWSDGYKTYAHLADIASIEIIEKIATANEENSDVLELLDKTIQEYYTTVDLKKIDIGGGMIHGCAQDFIEDESTKIILSHTSEPLSYDQKEIGSGAPFGTVDVLIDGHQNILYRISQHFLIEYFSDIDLSKFQILLNHPIETFNPETILLKEKFATENIYLIITGNIEMIDHDSGDIHMLSAGAFIGEISALYGVQIDKTYRSANFVNALVIPKNLYLEFIIQNNLYERMENLQNMTHFLQNSWLFGENVSSPLLHTIANEMQTIMLTQNNLLEGIDEKCVVVIKHGNLYLCSEEERIEGFKEGDFVCGVFIKKALSHNYHFMHDPHTSLLIISADSIKNVPIVAWKLVESNEKRFRLFNL
jgi:hemerythrin